MNEKNKAIYMQQRKKILPGLEFAIKYALTKKEIQLLILYLEKPRDSPELTGKYGINPTGLNHIVQRLKLKGLLQLKDRDLNMIKTMEFIDSSLD